MHGFEGTGKMNWWTKRGNFFSVRTGKNFPGIFDPVSFHYYYDFFRLVRSPLLNYLLIKKILSVTILISDDNNNIIIIISDIIIILFIIIDKFPGF